MTLPRWLKGARVLGQPIYSVYIQTIALLAVMAAISCAYMKTFPFALLAAVAVAVLTDFALSRFYFREKLANHASALITGMVVGGVAPLGAPLLAAASASAIAVASKRFLKVRSASLFNPAALGLLVALPLFSLTDQWWISGTYSVLGMLLPIAPVLVFAAYGVRRLPAALSFALASILISAASLSFPGSLPETLFPLLLGVNYMFAFVMLADPKTSPSPLRQQTLYGAGVAVAYFLLGSWKVEYFGLIALLAGNLAYSLYRHRGLIYGILKSGQFVERVK